MCINALQINPNGKELSQSYNKCWQKCGIISLLVAGMLVEQPLWENVWQLLKRLNTGITMEPSNPPPRYISKGTENTCPRICSQQNYSQAPKSTDDWINLHILCPASSIYFTLQMQSHVQVDVHTDAIVAICNRDWKPPQVTIYYH